MAKFNTLHNLVLAFVLLGLSSVTHAHEAHCKDTKLGEIMSQMKKPYKALKRNTGDFTITEQSASKLLELGKKARELTPLKIEEGLVSEEKLTDYQSDMKQTNETLNQIITAAQAKDEDSIKSLLKKLNKQRKQGHKAYRLDCD